MTAATRLCLFISAQFLQHFFPSCNPFQTQMFTILSHHFLLLGHTCSTLVTFGKICFQHLDFTAFAFWKSKITKVVVPQCSSFMHSSNHLFTLHLLMECCAMYWGYGGSQGREFAFCKEGRQGNSSIVWKML